MKFRSILAVFLALLMAVSTPARVLADAQPVYVSDVMVGMGKTAEEAKKALTDAGYTVLDKNVNEGGGSIGKVEKFVYIGYKTTTDPDEAVTDLSLMNMNGGYSFSDYEALLNKYRDSQIKPFIDSFIATIQEYRANYNSDNKANKAKAEYAYSVLSHIIEDDANNNMGELLLYPTKEELGMSDYFYNALSPNSKKTTVNLTTALLQGNAQVVFLMKQVLATAADTNETTWLERLAELGPDGLEKTYSEKGIRPTEANREMASLYNDTAKVILSGWESSRTALLDYEMSIADRKVNEGEEANVSDLINIGVEGIKAEVAEEAEDTEDAVDALLDPNNMMDVINGSLEASSDVSEAVADNQIAAVYAVLKETGYGDGTMFDFFTKPYAEVSGENISELYPMASTLTAGQIASIEFLPLNQILQIGTTDGESYIDCSKENSDLFEVIDSAGSVSIYLNVNREIFTKKTALTSDAMRKQTLAEKGWMDPDCDLYGLSRLSALSWAATGVSLAVAVVCAIKASPYLTQIEDCKKISDSLSKIVKRQQYMNSFTFTSYADKDKVFHLYKDVNGNPLDLTDDILSHTSFNVTRQGTEIKVIYRWNIGSAVKGYDLDAASKQALNDFSKYANKTKKIKIHSSTAKNLDIQVDYGQELINNAEDHGKEVLNNGKTWISMKHVATVVFFLMTAVTIYLTVSDLMSYYEVQYTPIPKYIVDEADITYTDADGNKLFTRNDTAYYTVASTNRPKDHSQYESLQDYSDLNGDVGKEWLALYSAKLSGAEPILADSFKAVTGSTSIPEGYSKGIHMFGSSAAANLTDSRYTYNDKLNGIYVYYKTDAAAVSDETASVFSGNAMALVGAGCGLAGAALGALVTVFVKKKKEEPQPV